MDVKMSISDFKGHLMSSLGQWIEERVEEFARNNPRMKVASMYIKRGAKNYLSRESESIDKMIDNATLFIADENGHIDSEMVINDLLTIFKDMEETPFHAGIFNGSIGKGIIRFELPDNFLSSFLFGDNQAIKITSADFEELRELMKGD